MSRDNTDVENLYEHLGLDASFYKNVSANTSKTSRKQWGLIAAANDAPPVAVDQIARLSRAPESDRQIRQRDDGLSVSVNHDAESEHHRSQASVAQTLAQVLAQRAANKSQVNGSTNGTTDSVDAATSAQKVTEMPAVASAHPVIDHATPVEAPSENAEGEDTAFVRSEQVDTMAAEMMKSIAGSSLSPESRRRGVSMVPEFPPASNERPAAEKPVARGTEDGAMPDTEKKGAAEMAISQTPAGTAPSFVSREKLLVKAQVVNSKPPEQQPQAESKPEVESSMLTSAFSRLRGKNPGADLEKRTEESNLPSSEVQQKNNNGLQGVFNRISRSGANR